MAPIHSKVGGTKYQYLTLITAVIFCGFEYSYGIRSIVVGGVSYLGHQNTKKCTINEVQMIGFEKTSRPFGFDDVLDQGLSRGLMLVKSASAKDWDLIVVNSVSARDKGHGNMNEE